MANSIIALYIRLSVEDEKYDSLSIENQQSILREKAVTLPEYASSEIVEFIDNGHMGTNFERPSVQRLLDMVRLGKVAAILVKDLSRFGRNSIETGYFIEKVFPLYHVRFISVSDNFDSAEHKGDTGGIELSFKYLINECYSRDMSVKTKTATFARIKRGEFQSKVCPYGYVKGNDGRLVPDSVTADTVRRIFEWAADGVSVSEIAHKLYEMHVPTPSEIKVSRGNKTHAGTNTNGAWCISTLLRILDDERYTGMYIGGKRCVTEIGKAQFRTKDESEWVKIPDHHAPIVSKELFERAKSQIQRHKIPKKHTHDYLLRGKVACGCCNRAMSRVLNSYYYCRRFEQVPDPPCKDLTIKVADLEQVVLETIRAQASCFVNIGSAESEIEQSSEQQEECGKKIRALQDSKRELYESFVLDEIGAAEYKARKSELDALIADARKVMAAAAADESSAREKQEDNLWKKKIADELDAADTLTKSLIDLLIKRVYVFPDNRIEIEYHLSSPFKA